MKRTIKTALISVFDKTGVVEFARKLEKLGITIYASGGTAKKLKSEGVPVIDVAELVGGSAILGHRVVTLSREIHAGLLAQYQDVDIKELEELGIPMIDLVYNNCYPLLEEIAKPDSSPESVIESTDIGGPTMLRSAAKGQRLVVIDPADLADVLDYIEKGEVAFDYLRYLAAKTEFYVSKYCAASAVYHGQGKYRAFFGEEVAKCKYGENAPQSTALYSSQTGDSLAVDKFQEITGKDLGYNNYCDLDRLLHTMTHIATGAKKNFSGQAVPSIAIGVKHGNPCGAAMTDNPVGAIEGMVVGDQRAIFGGFVMTNFEIDAKEANSLLFHGIDGDGMRMLDGIAAPSFTEEAREILTKRAKCRIVINEALATSAIEKLDKNDRYRQLRGGMMVQGAYSYVLDLNAADLVSGELTERIKKDIILAWAVGSTSNSNTITIVSQSKLIGNGVGQQDRVGCCELAVKRASDAGHINDLQGAVAYSDSFFPFPDGPEVLIKAGIKAIFSSSGSINDPKVIECCQKVGLTLVQVPDKICRGFFGH